MRGVQPSCLNFKNFPQDGAQHLRWLDDNDFHTIRSLSSSDTRPSASDEQECDEKEQRPHRENRRNQNPQAKRQSAESQEVTSAAAQLIAPPFLCFTISIYRGGPRGEKHPPPEKGAKKK